MNKYFADIQKAYRVYFNEYPEFTIPLPPTASNRLYFRLSGKGKSAIACYNPDKAENEAFIYISHKLKVAGVYCPEIYVAELDKDIYLQEDLGDVKLFDLVDEYRKNGSDEYLMWYKKVIDQMPLIQYEASRNFDFSKCFPREAFDRQSILWDLNYFKYYFLKLAKIPFHEQKLEDDFQALTDHLLEAPQDYFLFRDFQSRNIMITNNDLCFIDYQGGRRGSLQYDLASLLYEAKAGLTKAERDELLLHYVNVFNKYSFFSQDVFLKYFPGFILIRILQAFGAYGYRGYFEQKSFFLQSIPPALENLKEILSDNNFEQSMPHLTSVLHKLAHSDVIQIPDLDKTKLNVTINSFSYRKGIPQDYSGNGGGYVFDCRALPNPGRYDEFKQLTGMDKEVIDFFSDKKDVDVFLDSAEKLISASILNYLDRGHEHLLVNFGCTGGQHRSVYCAERMARVLKNNFNVNILLNHIEQKNSV